MLNGIMKTNTSRIVYLDILCILCCFMIVCHHSPMPTDSLKGWFCAGLYFVTMPGLVLFFMISGALLLPVQMNTRMFLKKRVTKVAVPTLCFIAIHLFIKTLKGVEINWWHTLLSLPFSVQGNGVLWFPYTLVGLYLVAPVISVWLQRISRKELEFYLLLWAVTLFYPLLKRVLTVNDTNTGLLYYFNGYLGYFVLGYYLRRYSSRLSFGLLAVLSVVAVLLEWLALSNGFGFGYLSLPVAVIATTLYVGAQKKDNCNVLNNSKFMWGCCVKPFVWCLSNSHYRYA